jgi:8-oxo-dGTP pyrophosphatase MutT (NUDIX family)
MDDTPPEGVADALRERAETAIADARERFGDAPHRDPLPFSRDHHPDDYPGSVAEQVDRIGGIAGAAVVDADGRVLAVDVNYNTRDWQTPGGAVEPGDSLAKTARKEVHEETGIDADLTGLLYTRPVHYQYDAGVAVLPMAVFAARKAGGETRVPARTIPDGREEIADVRWFHPDELPESTLDYEWVLAHCEGRHPPG